MGMVQDIAGGGNKKLPDPIWPRRSTSYFIDADIMLTHWTPLPLTAASPNLAVLSQGWLPSCNLALNHSLRHPAREERPEIAHSSASK